MEFNSRRWDDWIELLIVRNIVTPDNTGMPTCALSSVSKAVDSVGIKVQQCFSLLP